MSWLLEPFSYQYMLNAMWVSAIGRRSSALFSPAT